MKIHHKSIVSQRVAIALLLSGLMGCATSSVAVESTTQESTAEKNELLKNAKFKNGEEGWWVAGAKLTVKNEEACVTISDRGANRWDVILGQGGLGIEKGQSYQVSFTARSSVDTNFVTLIQHDGAPYTSYFLEEISVGADKKEYSFNFTQTEASDAKTGFQFQLGAQKEGDVCFSNISLQGKSFKKEVIIPNVHVNQVGYFPNAEKIATIKSDLKEPLAWQIKDSKGATLLSGMTTLFGLNKSSGESVHQADFSKLTTPHKELVLSVNGETSHPFRIADDIYTELKHDALAYFYQNRSGIEIKKEYVQRDNLARPAGHPNEVVSCFDGVDAKGNKWPGCDFDLDVSGGWYDAGDHGRYVVNSGISVWTLLNLYERSLWVDNANVPFADGTQPIPETNNKVNDLLDEVRWNLEFMMAMQIPEGKKVTVPVGDQSDNLSKLKLTEIDASGLAFHKVADEKWTGMPLPPHKDPMARTLYYPTTSATLNLAATAAQCARIWKDIDTEFSKQCLSSAERAWSAANLHPEVLAYDNFTGSGPYGDTQLADEIYWAAAELFITTGDSKYLKAVQSSPLYLVTPSDDKEASNGLFWGNLAAAGTVSLALVPNELPDSEVQKARKNIQNSADIFLKSVTDEGYHIPYTTEEYPWGSNSEIVNHGIFLTYATDYTGDIKYLQAAAHGMDYILGRNPLDQSYIVGYGENSLKNPHHRFWAFQADENSPKPAPGALSGGPNSINFSDPIASTIKGKCTGQTCFVDDIGAWTLNEVTINWNSPLVWLTTVLDEKRLNQ